MCAKDMSNILQQEILSNISQQDYDLLPGNNFTQKFNFCINCKCCTRHQRYRPNKFAYWCEYSSNLRQFKIQYKDGIGCECKCRHLSRMFCRIIEKPNLSGFKIEEDKM